MRANDTIRTGPAVSWLIPRAALILIVAGAAAVLCPTGPWFAAALVFAVIGAVFPSTLAAYGAVLCFLPGMLGSGPDLGRTMLAVLAVNLVQVLASLLLVIPPRTTVLIPALAPTARRLVLVQAVAQPLTALVLLAVGVAGVVEPWAAVAGAGALVVAAVLLIRERRGAVR